jgi:hypothetical protein
MGIEQVLTQYGLMGVQLLRTDVSKVSATGKTADSIRFEIQKKDNGNYIFRLLGREYFSTLETGRGPRKSSSYGEFDLNLLEYMKAKGIGQDLDDKKQRQLAKFLAYRINKEGDQTFKSGGRIVYSDTLTKFIQELTRAITKDFTQLAIKLVVSNLKT